MTNKPEPIDLDKLENELKVFQGVIYTESAKAARLYLAQQRAEPSDEAKREAYNDMPCCHTEKAKVYWFNKYYDIIRAALQAPSVPQGWKLVPVEPTEEMWGGLARDIVMWTRLFSANELTGKNLHWHLNALGREIPLWLAQEIPDHHSVPPKGIVAVVIYKAMIAAGQGAYPMTLDHVPGSCPQGRAGQAVGRSGREAKACVIDGGCIVTLPHILGAIAVLLFGCVIYLLYLGHIEDKRDNSLNFDGDHYD